MDTKKYQMTEISSTVNSKLIKTASHIKDKSLVVIKWYDIMTATNESIDWCQPTLMYSSGFFGGMVNYSDVVYVRLISTVNISDNAPTNDIIAIPLGSISYIKDYGTCKFGTEKKNDK